MAALKRGSKMAWEERKKSQRKRKKNKKKLGNHRKLPSPWSQATKTFEPHGLLGGGHGDRQAFFTGST
jgi:hypothetical protein